MHIVAKKQHRCIHEDTLHKPQNTDSLRDTGDDTMRMVFESNFTPRMSRLGLVQMETPDKTKSPWGGFTVLDLLTTKT